jgi:hypothetical protein
VGAHDVIVAAIARCGVSRAPIADWLREGKCRQLPGQMRRCRAVRMGARARGLD